MTRAELAMGLLALIVIGLSVIALVLMFGTLTTTVQP